MNLNNQNALYKHGMTPVFRVKGNPAWARLKQKVTFEVSATVLFDAVNCSLIVKHLNVFHPRFRSARSATNVLFSRKPLILHVAIPINTRLGGGSL